MVALFCLFKLFEIDVQVRFFFKSDTEYPREHLVLFIALPVRTRERSEHKRFEPARASHKRIFACVIEIRVLVCLDILTFDTGKMFRLVGHFGLGNKLLCIFALAYNFNDRQIGVYDAAHLHFNLFKIRLNDWDAEIKIIIKAVLGRPAGRKLRRWIDVSHCLCKHKCHRRTIHSLAKFIGKSDWLKIAVLVHNMRQRKTLAVNLAGEN